MIRNSRMRPSFVVILSFLVSLSISIPTNQNLATAIDSGVDPKYIVRACLTDGIGKPCAGNSALQEVPDLRVTYQDAEESCEETQGQRGSVTYTDLVLPTLTAPQQVFLVEVTTQVPGQDSSQGFFVRPTRKTRYWGKAKVSSTTATFYLAETGQFSVEFASDSIWTNIQDVTNFDALMLFVNPEINIPTTNIITVSPNSKSISEDLGPNQNYIFKANIDYDWGRDHVFKVHDNTNVYFEKGAHVRARIVQTEKKVKNVLLQGYGTLDVHYDLEDDLIGISDDATRQNIGIYGKNIRVMGLTLLNTNPSCGIFGYCLNINANWSPLTNSDTQPFDAGELQTGYPPYSFQPAHCQENNMDDSPNNDLTNCPTSHADGQHVSYVKCMTWQMGHDGLNAGKWGTVEKSFVRTLDDAIKPWDSHGIYKDVTIWQLTLGWPINFGWWNWNQPDVDTTVDSIFVIHNHNWVTSPQWPDSASGQCTVGGIYGSGAIKKGYRLSNIFVETAASCAVGLTISKNAYSKHLTPEGCVASIIDTKIEGMYFDEPFYQTGGYTNYLSGEPRPEKACTGDEEGKIETMVLSGSVAGLPLSRSDFVVEDTVSGLTFERPPPDPHPSAPHYQHYPNQNAYLGVGASGEIGEAYEVLSVIQCLDKCQADWSCDCVVYHSAEKLCWKRRNCDVSSFDTDDHYDVYVRSWEVNPPLPSPPQPTVTPTECSDDFDLTYKNKDWKDCEWVRKKPNARCHKRWKRKLLNISCPESCQVCGCVDDPYFRFQKNKYFHCRWVGMAKDERCKKQWKGKALSHYCPVSCDTCDEV